jgi:serine/threonine protein kinase
LANSADETLIPAPLPMRFQFVSTLGEGGLGTVVKAIDTQLDTLVAIKTIKHELRNSDPRRYEDLRERFRREAIAGARVRSSPYIVTVYDQVVDAEGNAFLILEYVPGGTVKDRMERGPVSVEEALQVTADAATGLQAMHARSLVHRDIKPANIFLTEEGRAKVGDLGIVQMGDAPLQTRADGMNIGHGHPGTPRYMSPEQRTTTDLLPPHPINIVSG